MSYLAELLDSTKTRVGEARVRVTEEVLEQRLASVGPARGFAGALTGPDTAIVAEIKRASPSKGALNLKLDAGATARAYARGGAAAVSVLTEPSRFEGSLEDMQAARGAGLPVLRKDFIIDTFQVMESRAAGADAVLLIVKALGPELADLIAACRALGMDALVEVNDESELERAIEARAELIGINHRDLVTFEVDPELTAKLAPRVPEGIPTVSLSGVSTRAEIEELATAGADAVLVGESLVTASDPEAKLRELLGR